MTARKIACCTQSSPTWVIAFVNLRGLRESGTAFMLPTLLFIACLVGMIRIPIESRSICGFSPTGGSRKKYVLREMDVQAALFRLYGNWTECV